MIGSDAAVTSDQIEIDDYPPERPHGIQFVDADVSDESFADRAAQEEPEVSEADIDERDADAEVTDESFDERLAQEES